MMTADAVKKEVPDAPVEHSMPRVLRNLFDSDGLARLNGWTPFREGVDILRLYTDPEKDGPHAALLRYAAGASVPLHDHYGYEHILVLQGEQEDDFGCYGSGTCIVNEPGSRHAVHSRNGCVVLVIWNRPVRFCAEAST